MIGSKKVDMCEGALLPNLLMFAIPLIASNILQLLFNAADVIVVGRFTGSGALAAVGATTVLINLLVNFFIGVSIGTNVVVAHFYGAKDNRAIHETVHTAIVAALVCGFLMTLIGELMAGPMLTLMGTPSDVINDSVLYLKIYFIGMPAFMLYNFGAAIMRSSGDTKRPLYYLLTSGIVNVILNLIFVAIFNMGVAGVALATTISQCLSASLIIIYLIRTDGANRLIIRDLKIYKSRLGQIMRIGLTAGLQSIVFNISNVQIQASINSFGSTVVAGSAAASSIEGFVYTSMDAVAQTSLSFTGQNFGAQKYSRIDKILVECTIISTVIGIVMGVGAYLMGDMLIGIYNSDPEVIKSGIYRLMLICVPYFICGIMDEFAAALRGLGHSAMPTIVSFLGACVFRVIWILTVFKIYHTQFAIFISYPISWILTSAVLFICYMKVRKEFPSTDK